MARNTVNRPSNANTQGEAQKAANETTQTAHAPADGTAVHFKSDDTAKLVLANYAAWGNASVNMVGAFALHVISGVYPGDGEAKRSVKESLEQIRILLEQTGGKSKAYQYASLAKAFVNTLAKKDKMGGTIGEVISSENAQEAHAAIMRRIDKMTNGANTLEALGGPKALNLYNRNTGGNRATGNDGEVKATRAEPEAIAARIVAEPDVFDSMDEKARNEMLATFILNADADTCEYIIGLAEKRLTMLAEGAKDVSDEAAAQPQAHRNQERQRLAAGA